MEKVDNLFYFQKFSVMEICFYFCNRGSMFQEIEILNYIFYLDVWLIWVKIVFGVFFILVLLSFFGFFDDV